MTSASCDHCGAVLPAGELHRFDRIEEVVVDLKAGVEAERPIGRGRTPWLSPRRRAPAVLVRTPRYQYVQASYRLCTECLQRAEADEQSLGRFHRRATLVVACVAAGLGVLLLSSWVFMPGAYAGLGLAGSSPAQPFAGAPPPTTKPYKPPFSATTPTAP